MKGKYSYISIKWLFARLFTVIVAEEIWKPSVSINFQSNKNLKQQWLMKIKHKKMHLIQHGTICHLHFEEDCFKRSFQIKKRICVLFINICKNQGKYLQLMKRTLKTMKSLEHARICHVHFKDHCLKKIVGVLKYFCLVYEYF